MNWFWRKHREPLKKKAAPLPMAEDLIKVSEALALAIAELKQKRTGL